MYNYFCPCVQFVLPRLVYHYIRVPLAPRQSYEIKNHVGEFLVKQLCTFFPGKLVWALQYNEHLKCTTGNKNDDERNNIRYV